ncbi:MAG: hypothetical protein FJW20_03390 [Acidimicrobiia bacterium]|nr:hypothetical protein [Acidimicrobiia bacterium]
MLVVVGGHTRNIGKTSVAAGLIAALPEARWTAMKITQHGHGICSAAGEPCDCAIEYEHPFALSQETAPSSTDSGRFLAAGAERAYWLRTPIGHLGQAMTQVRSILASSENAVFESNSILNFLRPDLFLAVLDYSSTDMKDSARRFLSRADALVIVERNHQAISWEGVPERWLTGKPQFHAKPPRYVTRELAEFVAGRLGIKPAAAR